MLANMGKLLPPSYKKPAESSFVILLDNHKVASVVTFASVKDFMSHIELQGMVSEPPMVHLTLFPSPFMLFLTHHTHMETTHICTHMHIVM
jgi:hypothetical protein